MVIRDFSRVVEVVELVLVLVPVLVLVLVVLVVVVVVDYKVTMDKPVKNIREVEVVDVQIQGHRVEVARVLYS